MARETFVAWNPRGSTLEVVDKCNEIIAAYRAQGLTLTLRQLYYQFVSRDLIPNTEKSYKNLGNVVSKARLAGMLDWNAIEDRGREPDRRSEFSNLEDLVDAAVRSYRLPRWQGQRCYAELWVEKAALAGVLEPLARKWHVTLMVNKGYSSQSAMYASAQRFIDAFGADDGPARDMWLFYLGDHDPSGEDMVRDIQDRLNLFTRADGMVTVRKLALTMAQIEEYDPPPNPAKMSDSRAGKYVDKHGYESWEVDALEPRVLQELINVAFEEIVDSDLMDTVIEREELDKTKLRKAAKRLTKG
jgi:hypothetical protein